MKGCRLTDCVFNKEYQIKEIINLDNGLKKRLIDLGFKENEKIKVLKNNYFNKSYLVKIVGINYAIDKKICENILVVS